MEPEPTDQAAGVPLAPPPRATECGDAAELSAETIRGLLDGGGLATAYQPIIDIRRNVVCGWEALLRAHHADIGAIAPLVLVASAQEHGLLDAVTHRVIEDAWNTVTLATDLVAEPLRINVNLELAQLSPRSGLIGWLAAIEWPEQITVTVEITERGGDLWTPGHESAAARLEARGLRLAIDDYGAGSARMSFLHKRAWDMVKLDRQLVGAMGERERVVIRRFVQTLADLGAGSLIEGVETPTQLAVARELGVDFAQGYLLGMPVPGAVLLADLRHHGLGVRVGGRPLS